MWILIALPVAIAFVFWLVHKPNKTIVNVFHFASSDDYGCSDTIVENRDLNDSMTFWSRENDTDDDGFEYDK